jgi:hypothetical protein
MNSLSFDCKYQLHYLISYYLPFLCIFFTFILEMKDSYHFNDFSINFQDSCYHKTVQNTKSSILMEVLMQTRKKYLFKDAIPK